MSSLISVITVCRNAGCDVERTLASVAAQRGVQVECVVQNGEPADHMPQLLADRWPDLVRLETRLDSGIYNAMNRALRRAQGAFVVFLNAGDTFHKPDSLKAWVAELEAVPQASVMICAYHNAFDGTVTYYPQKPSRLFLYRNNFCHQAQMWRLSRLQDYGPFDESYRILADRALLLRAVAGGAVMAVSRLVAVVYKDNGTSAAPANRNLKQNELRRTQRQAFTPVERISFAAFEVVTAKAARMWFYWQFRGTRLFRSYKHIVNFLNGG